MISPRILLVGYYGKGNFGDDVLLSATYGIVKNAFPDGLFSIIIDGDKGGYVEAMFGDMKILKPARHGAFDLIIHGGGGVFFDFQTYDLLHQMMERLIRFFGFHRFLSLEKMARKVTNKSRTSTTHRLGFGIGVGTFSAGSPRLFYSLPIIADFDALWVRDAQSIQNLKRFSSAMRAEQIQGSDLAFLTEYWIEEPILQRINSSRARLGIILRDWPGMDLEKYNEIIKKLAREYDITGFIFDQHTDPQCQALLAPYKTYIWRPEVMRIADFTRILGQQNVLLTSRAHGAICGACLGIPSVIVNIEPKLEQVHAMLSGSSMIVSPNETGLWEEKIKEALRVPSDVIEADFNLNHIKSKVALKKMENWLR